jgi:Rhodopirellula transposase DDE domain
MIRLPARQNLTTNHAYKSRGTQRVTTRTKDKYLGVIKIHYLLILEIYLLYEKKKPVMLLDVTEGKIYAYPYKKFKKELNESGRMSLTKQYDDALRGDQFVIFIRDSQKKKLISYSLERPSKIGSDTRQYRIRRPGGGRKLTEEKDPTIVTALEQMLKDEVAGDPMTEQKWIRSSLQRLSERLADEGHQASSGVVARLLKKMGFSLKANKRKQGRWGCPDRDEQFKYIASQKQQFITAGLPIISIDTKKKELIGDFRNKGRTWRRQAEEVNEHDFPGAAKCRAVPFGIYDPTRNEGYVYVGLSNDTPNLPFTQLCGGGRVKGVVDTQEQAHYSSWQIVAGATAAGRGLGSSAFKRSSAMSLV